MNLKSVIPNKINMTQKEKYCLSSLTSATKAESGIMVKSVVLNKINMTQKVKIYMSSLTSATKVASRRRVIRS